MISMKFVMLFDDNIPSFVIYEKFENKNRSSKMLKYPNYK